MLPLFFTLVCHLRYITTIIFRGKTKMPPESLRLLIELADGTVKETIHKCGVVN